MAREKLHANGAEKQAAYRARKRATTGDAERDELLASLYLAGTDGEPAPYDPALGLGKAQAEETLAWAEGVWQRQAVQIEAGTDAKRAWGEIRDRLNSK